MVTVTPRDGDGRISLVLSEGPREEVRGPVPGDEGRRRKGKGTSLDGTDEDSRGEVSSGLYHQGRNVSGRVRPGKESGRAPKGDVSVDNGHRP